MKKKVLSLLFVLCLIVPCLFLITACGETSSTTEFTGEINLLTGSVVIGKDKITQGDKIYTYSEGDEITITCKNIDGGYSYTSNQISIEKDINANITLAGVLIDCLSKSLPAIKIADNSSGNVKITLAEGSVNKLTAGTANSAIQKNGANATGMLIITGKGSLRVNGGANGSGIGASAGVSASNILIEDGVITASGGVAGIGGGRGGAIDNLFITGGSVKTAILGCTPTNREENVYLFELPVDGTKNVVINGKRYPVNHESDNKLYVYLPARNIKQPNVIKIGDEVKKVFYNAEEFTWYTVVEDSIPPAIESSYVYGFNLEDIELGNGWFWLDGAYVPTVGTHSLMAYKLQGTSYLTSYIDVVVTTKYIDIPEANINTFYYNGREQNYALELNEYYTIIGNIQREVGEYTVTVELKDVENTKWIDETVLAKTYNFKINKGQQIITAEDFTIAYGKSGIIEASTNGDGDLHFEIVDDTNNVVTLKDNGVFTTNKVGEVEILISAAETDNYAPVEKTITISVGKKQVKVPVADLTSFTYDGSVKTYVIGQSSFYTIDGNKQTDAGEYIVTVSLNNTEDFEWDDGTVSAKTYNFRINKLRILVPLADTTSYTYNGTLQKYILIANDNYTISGNEQRNAGTYVVEVSLKDTKNCEWSDFSIANKTYDFVIAKKEITVVAKDYQSRVGVTTLPNPEFVVNGVISGDILTDANIVVRYDSYNSNVAGQYKIIVSGNAETTNYVIEYVNGTLTITSLNIQTLNASDITLEYGSTKTISATSNILTTIRFNVVVGRDVISVNQTGVITTLKAGEAIVSVVADAKQAYAEQTKLIKVTVTKKNIAVPVANTATFVYSGPEATITYSLETSSYYTISNNIQTNAGRYIVNVSLNDLESCQWADGSTSDKQYEFIINKASVELPIADNNKFYYNGNEQRYLPVCEAICEIYGNVYTDAGTYKVAVILKDTNNYAWVDGTTGPKYLDFVINKNVVSIPSASQTRYVYNGNKQTYSLTQNSAYLLSGHIQTNAGVYSVAVTLKDPANNEWSDGSVEIKNYEFIIYKQVIEIPENDTTEYIYSGSEQTYFIAQNVNYVIVGNTQVNVGNYTVSVSLIDSDNFEWSDGSITTKTYTFKINKQKIEIPIADPTVYRYTGAVQTYTLVQNVNYTIMGNQQTTVGSYVVTVMLNDTNNFEWKDSSLTSKIYTFRIEKQQVEIPVADMSEYVYTGSAQTYAIPSNDGYSISGATQVNAGIYNVLVTLNDTENYEWVDGTVINRNFEFVINKQKVLPPSPSTKVYRYNGTEQTYEIEAKNYYTITNHIQTNAGEYVVTVTLNDPANYEWVKEVPAYTFKILKAKVIIAAKDYEITQGEEIPEFGYKVSGLAENDNLPITPNITCEAENSETLGTYKLIITGDAESTNYTFSYVNGSLRVTEVEDYTTGIIVVAGLGALLILCWILSMVKKKKKRKMTSSSNDDDVLTINITHKDD